DLSGLLLTQQAAAADADVQVQGGQHASLDRTAGHVEALDPETIRPVASAALLPDPHLPRSRLGALDWRLFDVLTLQLLAFHRQRNNVDCHVPKTRVWFSQHSKANASKTDFCARVMCGRR